MSVLWIAVAWAHAIEQQQAMCRGQRAIMGDLAAPAHQRQMRDLPPDILERVRDSLSVNASAIAHFGASMASVPAANDEPSGPALA